MQQEVVFIEHAFGDAQMTLEGGSRGILMLHHCSKHKGGYKGNAQRVCHGAVVLFKGVFVDVQSQSMIQVFEEDAPHVVALADDDGILFRELLQVGKGGAEHGVSAHIRMPALFVKLLEMCFDR